MTAAHTIRVLVRAVAAVLLAELTVRAWRDTAREYGAGVLALTFAVLCLACYAFGEAFARPVRTWGDDAR